MASVLFVCLGNICRSPMAEAVFKAKAQVTQWGQSIRVDSAGTGDWHLGHAPDKRAQAALKARGYDGSDLRARLITTDDFDQFEYVVVMDHNNHLDLSAMKSPAPTNVHLFLDWESSETVEVPDPYYGNQADFQYALDLIEQAADGLLAEIRQRHVTAEQS